MREPALPDGVPQPLDQELLAWAAGFFDGEGSTMARAFAGRPGYFQLDVSVPQSGPTGVPEVLLKFQRAMLGIGSIARDSGEMYKWTVRGRLSSELLLGLMWPWLGEVKKQQASAAIELVAQQYDEGRYRSRRARYRPTLIAHGELVKTDGDRLERAWAAGFMDGEGYFGIARTNERKDGTQGLVVRASATQHGQPNVPAAVLVRLRCLFPKSRIERHGEIDDFKWITEGAVNVREVVEALGPWLGSVKTAQAKAALEAHVASRVRGDSETCIRGHVYDGVYVRPNGTVHRRCSACHRIRDRLKAQRRGARPRVLRNRPRDPSRAYRVN